MDHKSAFSDTFNQTLLGLIIGWGGFSTLLPNLLEGLSAVFELGSFRSLRIFSIVFFVLPIFSFVLYWKLRGSLFTFKSVSSSKYRVSSLHFSVVLLGVILVLLPVGVFMHNEFLIKKSHYLLIWYTVLACLFHTYVVHFQVKTREKTGTNAVYETTSFFVFFLLILLGIGVFSFIEPWVMYRADINLYILCCSIFYLIYGLVNYLCFKKEKHLFINYKRFSFGSVWLLFIVSCYPSLTYDEKYTNYVRWIYIAYAIVLVISPIIKGVITKSNTKRTSTMPVIRFTIEISVIIGLLIMVQNVLVCDLLKKTNQSYYESRLEAMKKVSKKKIFPLIHFDSRSDLDKNIQKIAKAQASSKDNSANRESIVDSLRVVFADTIYALNHKIVDVINYRSNNKDNLDLEFPGLSPKNLVDFVNDTINNKFKTVQGFFYSSYLKREKTKKSKRDNLTVFYNKQYENIENIIGSYLIPASRLPMENNLEYYYHPINYYSKTLKHYKKQVDIAHKLYLLNNEYIWEDSINRAYIGGNSVFLKKLKSIKKEIHGELKNIPELNNPKFLEIRPKKPASSSTIVEYLGVNKILGVTSNNKTKHASLLPYILYLKKQQYINRFERAQHIFKSYLVDSQRIGVFILLSTLFTLFLIYWLLQKINSPSTENQNLDELPRGYINISILVFVILFIHIARPIKSENINPEQPHWMMNLDNWYEKSAVLKFFGAENEAQKTINYYSKNDLNKVTREVEKSNTFLKEISDNLK